MAIFDRVKFDDNSLYLIDGSAFVYRGFYAFQNMTRSDGFPTNAIYIVARILCRILREEKPKYLAFILDGKGKSFRADIYDKYKAQRSSTPEALIKQLEPLKQLLSYLGIPLLVSENYEADDYIASLANQFKSTNSIVIVGADKDLKQCLSDNVVLWDPAAKDEKLLNLSDFLELEQMQPSSWPDYQALIGDSSDNIPGIPKIGPKTAKGLILEYPTLEDIYSNIESLPPKLKDKIKDFEKEVFLYRELTRLKTDLNLSKTLKDLRISAPNMKDVLSFMNEFELRSLSREVSSMERAGVFNKISSSNSSVSSNSSKLFSNLNEAQGSLISYADPKDSVDITTISNINEISKDELVKSGHKIAVMLINKKIHLALSTTEYVYKGDIKELINFITQNSLTVVTSSYKELCVQVPLFWEIDFNNWLDISLAAYLLNPDERSYSWDSLSIRLGDLSGSPYSSNNPALNALYIANYEYKQLEGTTLLPVYNKIEIPLVKVLFLMEDRGIRIDENAFNEFLLEVQSRLDNLTKLIYSLAGKEFNIRSSQQLGEIIFSDLNLPHAGKTKGGAFSTSQENLEKLSGKHEIIDAILEYRMLEKLRSTYLEPIPKLADSAKRIHTTFNQTATATGRLSSSNPNLQNIPIRGDFGRRMRQCFISSPGNKLVCADYSQIELRILAHLSKDETLLDAFRNSEDIHKRTASLLYDVSVSEVSKTERQNAKTINFGLLYGMGSQKLAREMNLSIKEAKEFIETYFSRLTKLKEFYESIEDDAKNHGYITTMTGRRRLIPDIFSSNLQLQAQAKRQAINTKIQGTAADIIKIAMLDVENDEILKSLNAKLILQIHDELVIEVPENNAKEAGERINYLMSSVKPGGEELSVPLIVEWGIGFNWGDAH